MDGWIKLWRILIEKPIWLRSTPEQKSVLIVLLCLANHEENEWEWKGEKFKVRPGEFVTSLESIRKKSGLGISIQNVRSSLTRFKKLEFLTYKATKMGRVITICNWNEYQPNEKATQQRTQQTGNKGATKTQQLTRMKEGKNDKKEGIKDFDIFWAIYPKKKKKEDARKAFAVLVKNNNFPEVSVLVEAVKAQKNTNDWKKEGGQFIPHPATWLRSGSWQDEIHVNNLDGVVSQKTQRTIQNLMEADLK